MWTRTPQAQRKRSIHLSAMRPETKKRKQKKTGKTLKHQPEAAVTAVTSASAGAPADAGSSAPEGAVAAFLLAFELFFVAAASLGGLPTAFATPFSTTSATLAFVAFAIFPTSAAVTGALGFAVRLGVLVLDFVTPPAFLDVDARRFFVDEEVGIGSIMRGRALPVEPRVTAILSSSRVGISMGILLFGTKPLAVYQGGCDVPGFISW